MIFTCVVPSSELGPPIPSPASEYLCPPGTKKVPLACKVSYKNSEPGLEPEPKEIFSAPQHGERCNIMKAILFLYRYRSSSSSSPTYLYLYRRWTSTTSWWRWWRTGTRTGSTPSRGSSRRTSSTSGQGILNIYNIYPEPGLDWIGFNWVSWSGYRGRGLQAQIEKKKTSWLE